MLPLAADANFDESFDEEGFTMSQALSLHQLTDRLVRIEKEVSVIRKELADLRQQAKVTPQALAIRSAVAYPWADKEHQRRWIKDLFAALSIQGAPMGAQVLQQSMGQAGLTPGELSRGLVEAREE